MKKISTALGNVPETDLHSRVLKENHENEWIIAHECLYLGSEFPESYGKIVRRDVWVIVKEGQSASAAAEPAVVAPTA
jgi:hypothetical protein